MIVDGASAGSGRPGRAMFVTVATPIALVMAMAVLPTATLELQRRRSVQVTAIGDKGAPVEGLTPADLVVKEDGKTCTVVEAAPSTARISVALLLDDRGSDINEIREALAAFGARVQGRAEVSLISVVPTIATVFDYTAEGAIMMAGIRRLVWRPGPAGGLLLGAIADAADGLRQREAARPAIVVVTFEGSEFKSHRRAPDVLASLERSRATLHVVAVGTPTLRRMSRARVESGDAQGDEWTVDEAIVTPCSRKVLACRAGVGMSSRWRPACNPRPRPRGQ